MRRRFLIAAALAVLGACSSTRRLPGATAQANKDAGGDAAAAGAPDLGSAVDAGAAVDAVAVDAVAVDLVAVDQAAGADTGDGAASETMVEVDSSPTPRTRVSAEAFAGTVPSASFASIGSSWSRAIATGGGKVVAVNPESDSVTVLAGMPPAVRAEIPVGRDPRNLTVTADGRWAVVVNRGDATVSIVDLEAGQESFYFRTEALPYAAIIAGGRIFVTEWATGHLVAFDPTTRALVGRIAVDPFPAGIAHCGPPACALPAGRGLLVTHFYSGRLSLIDPITLAATRVIETGADTNWSQHVALAPDGQRAYLPQTRFFVDNPVRQFDSSVFPVVNVIDLATFTVVNAARITLDTADQPIGLPVAVDFLSGGQLLVTANAASDDLSIIDLQTGRKTAHVEVGANPQGVVTAPDGRSLFINQVLDGSLRVLDAQSWQLIAEPPLTKLPLAPQLLRGKKLFWSSSRPDLARDQWMACATCHFDGFHDARTWRSFPDGPRNTTALFNLADTTPLHWSGDLDEVADVEATVRFIQAGKGLAPAAKIDTLGDPLTGVSPDLDDLAAFLRTLRPPASPHQQDGAGIARGRALFDQLACASCHAGPNFTDRKNHDVGTGDPLVERNSHGRGVSFDTPSLFGLWLTAPYLHDGSAARLEDLFVRGPAHDLGTRASAQQSADLISYLRSL